MKTAETEKHLSGEIGREIERKLKEKANNAKLIEDVESVKTVSEHSIEKYDKVDKKNNLIIQGINIKAAAKMCNLKVIKYIWCRNTSD